MNKYRRIQVVGKNLLYNLKRSWFEIHDSLPSMFFTALMIVTSGLIFQKSTWNDLALYWQRVDDGFDNELQKQKVLRSGKISIISWVTTIAFLWAYYLVSEVISFIISTDDNSGVTVLFFPVNLFVALKALAGFVIVIGALIISCIIGILINIVLALIRSRINFYAAFLIGFVNMLVLFITHYTVPVFNLQGAFLPMEMREAYFRAISSYGILISGAVVLFSIIGIGTIHLQFLKADGMFRLFRIAQTENQSRKDISSKE